MLWGVGLVCDFVFVVLGLMWCLLIGIDDEVLIGGCDLVVMFVGEGGIVCLGLFV